MLSYTTYRSFINKLRGIGQGKKKAQSEEKKQSPESDSD